MKTKLLMMALCATMLFACKDDKKKKEALPDPATELEAIEKASAAKKEKQAEMYKDSVQKAEAEEMQLFVKDSVAALGIKGYKVKMVSGKHKYGGKTMIEYQSLHQVIAEHKADAKKKMLSKEEEDRTISGDKSYYKGGRITLHIDRSTIGSANSENFTVIVKDKDDKEISRESFANDIPEYSSDSWWNLEIVGIKNRVESPFYVYVVDILEDTPFKFEVTSIKK